MNRFLVALACGLLGVSSSLAQEVWQFVNPTPAIEQIRALAASADTLVAVGETGLVLTTTDGIDWIRQDPGTRETFETVAHQGGVWLAYGSSGTIFSSTDGVAWQQRSGGLGSGKFTFGNGVHVASTGDSATQLRVSTDGFNWTQVSLTPGVARTVTDMVYAHDRFWACTKAGKLFFSTDGETWTIDASAPAPASFDRLVTGNGLLLLVAHAASWSQGTLFGRNPDTSWSRVANDTNSILALSFAGDRFFKDDGGLLYSATDGVNWTAGDDAPMPNMNVESVAYAFGQWWMVNKQGRLHGSSDGLGWSIIGSNRKLDSANIVPIGTDLLTGDGNTLVNGQTWQSDGFVPPMADYSSHYQLYSANGRAFAVVTVRQNFSTVGIEIWAVDTVTSGHRVATIDSASRAETILFANGLYFTRILRNSVWIPVTSPDGETWTEQTTDNDAPLVDEVIGTADGTFWALVRKGSGIRDLWSSIDGLNWTFALATVNNALPRSIATDGETLLVGTTGGYYYHTAADGWTYHDGPAMERVHFDGTHYHAVSRWQTWEDWALLTMAADQTWSTQLQYRFGNFASFATLSGKTFAKSNNVLAYRDIDAGLSLERGLPLLTQAVVGESLVLSVAAVSADNLALTYQWSANGVDIPGATASSLDVTLEDLNDVPTSYGVRVSDGTHTVRAHTVFKSYATAVPQLIGSPDTNPINITFKPEAGFSSVFFHIIAEGPGPLTYEWTRDGEIIPGATGSSFSLGMDANDNGTVIAVKVSNAHGSVSASNIVNGPVPHITGDGTIYPNYYHQPQTGQTRLTLRIYADWSWWYQWRRNGVAIPGENGPSFTRFDFQPEESGYYDVVVANSWGSVTSPSIFIPALRTARLSNLSVRAWAGSGNDTLTPGVVLARVQNQMTPLVRAIGPTLLKFGVETPLPDPSITALLTDGTPLNSNDQWGDTPGLDHEFNRLGAFALEADSLDAAMQLVNLPRAEGFTRFTMPVTSVTHEGGDALVEIYDSDPDHPTSDRLTNVSARARVHAGHPLITGFVINGPGTLKLLIRAAGPALSDYAIETPLAKPQLLLVDADNQIMASNTQWETAENIAELRAARSLVGAFDFAADSHDAALLVELPAGVYSAVVQGIDGAEGVALVELYEVP